MKRKDADAAVDPSENMITEEFRMPASLKTPSRMDKKGIIFLSYACVLLYSTSVFVQNSIMPFKVKSLGVGAAMFGYLQTLYAICQLCGGPIFGRFGDLFGSKLALIIAFTATGLSYFILGISSTIFMLFMSRIPTILMHVMQGSQMVITDVTDDKERADALGKAGVAFGVGMIIGPFFGGIITKKFGEFIGACCATMLCGVGIFIALVFLPDQVLKRRKKEILLTRNGNLTQDNSPASSSKGGMMDLRKFLHIVSIPSVAYVLFIKCMCGIPMGIFHSMFAVVAVEYFKLQPEQNGMVMSYIGIVGLITQGFGIGFLTKRFAEKQILLAAIVSISFAYFLLMVMVQNVYQFCIAAFPLVVGGSSLNVITNSVLTKSVPSSDTGATLGVSMAVHSLIRTVAPTIGGLLLSTWGFPSFGAVGFVTTSVLLIVLLFIKSPV